MAGFETLGIMQKPPLTFWQAVLLIVIGVALYFVDCFFQYKSHPDVPWIQSGIYAGWGLLFDVACILTGIYGLAKLCE
jgi:hypothetical protein